LEGGANNAGTVFELVNNNGTYTLSTLIAFNGSNGRFPVSGLIADVNGDLFGTTEFGGTNNEGTVFELVNNDGTYTLSTLVNFNGSNGTEPVSGLTADANGDLFGTTSGGGANGDGTVFEIVRRPEMPLPFGPSATHHHGIPGAVVTQSYGEGDHGTGSSSFDKLLYYSVDYSLDFGTPVLAEGNGTVVYVSDTAQDTKNEAPTYTNDLTPIKGEAIPTHLGPHNLGNYVTIEYDNGVYATYAHLEFVTPNKLPVQVNQHVSAGQLIGFVGDTGRSLERISMSLTA
jgi:murein DD-endopeptidase MepM/ murein hydrolase activator NlpD